MEVDMENSQVSQPAAKGGNGKAGKAPLAPTNAKDGKTIEETYQKLSQLEHVLLRPDTYIGSTDRQQEKMWVHDGEKMVHRTIEFVPGLYKIFDEILVNAADNKVRDPSMDKLKVDIDEAKGTITVLNNGAGIPVEVHRVEKIYVPELIFGNLLTSSNYNDNEKKVTGGRNGYGAKLANIFSKNFTVETCDGKRKLRYKQVFSKNMSQKGEPVIAPCSSDDNWTSISFQPDLARFGMESLEEDSVALMRKRVYDMAGILGKGVKVYLNGKKVPVKSFQDYVDLYLGPKDTGVPRVYERINDRWEVCISTTDGQLNQVSFVNAICTTKGGTHVNYVMDQVTKYLVELITKKDKKTTVKPFMVKNYVWVFVNCLIENPAFDSQTKDTLTLRASSFGSKCELSDAYLKKVANSGLLDAVMSFASFKANKDLKKSDGAKRSRVTGIPKLDDANDAGTRNSENCTLILTEGDSAKTLAIAGLSVVGRDRYGVFPLRGKLLNVRDASTTQVTGNAEIQNIKQILGLQHGKVYSDVKSLRYGHLMIMTDQDHDGSHIKGLIMNFFHHFYPSLLRVPGFLVEFITPIIKATKGKQTLTFYTMPEYEAWKENNSTRGWAIKYYKGLGTSTAKEAKEYFAAIDSHRKEFTWEGDEDGQAIEMAFSKKKVDDRKDWLKNFQPGTYLDNSADTITYSDFVHKELILFSRADLDRSIPSMVDGLKPGQRKILFACFKRNLKKDIKVAQLAGYVAEHSAYHHGEASLMSTIIGLAQDYVGSNNINLLVPSGQFGTRLQGGKDAASPRYIFTRLEQLTRHMFHEADDALLKYLDEEGQSIEPEWYVPVLPAVLVNGAEGIGTGWSTSIPNFNPQDVVDNLRRMLDGEDPQPMQPWYRDFKGTIQEVPTKTSGKSYQINGVITQLDDTTLEISELPVRKWTQDYKEFLEELVKPEDKNATPFILDYKEHHTDVSVKFVIKLAPEKMQEALAAGLHNKFKLAAKISTGNMMLFNSEGVIRKYDTAEDILREFYDLRLGYYTNRKASLLKAAEADLLRISNKVRFILAVVGGQLRISNRRKADIEAELEREGYDRLPSNKKKQQIAEQEEPEDSEGNAAGAAGDAGNYDYLLSMPISSLTLEKVQSLQQEAEETQAHVERLRATTEKQMWRDDLDAFQQAYEEFEAEHQRQATLLIKQQAGARKKGGGAAKGKAAAKKKSKATMGSSEDEASSESDDDFEENWAPAAKKAPARKPAAAKPAPAASGPSQTSSMAVSQRPVPVLAAAAAPAAKKAPARKAVAAAPKGKAAAAPQVNLADSDDDNPGPSAAPPKPAQVEEVSLLARLAGRLDIGGPGLAAAGAARPGRAAAAAAAKKTADLVILSDSDEEEEEEVNSPVPPLKKPAAKPRGPSNLGEKRKPAEKKAAAAAAPAAPKAAVVQDDDDDMPSPAPKPQAKVQRMRPSPFHKGSGKPKPAAGASNLGKKPAGGKGKAVVESESESSDGEVEVMEESPAPKKAVVAARAAAPRRAAAVSKPKYTVDDESEFESESDGGDDYAPSD
ncbi:hypothetical protein N2152v2_004953 [Parachlorella kessleri]